LLKAGQVLAIRLHVLVLDFSAMKKLLLVVLLIGASLQAGLAERRNTLRRKPVAVAFFDAERLQSSEGQATFEDFRFFFESIHQIVERDFPGVELWILERGQLLSLPDGTRLNVGTIQPELGFVFAAPGKKRLMLSGVRSDTDFACAAATFFKRSSPSCPK
jgi:hypothetical protein